jgi:hypothetical protein
MQEIWYPWLNEQRRLVGRKEGGYPSGSPTPFTYNLWEVARGSINNARILA